MADPPARNSGKWSPDHQKRAKKAGFKTYVAWIKRLETHTTAGKKLRVPRKICGGWRSSAGHPCARAAGHGTDHAGTGRCNECFGNNPWGSDAPAYRGKGYSRFLPDDLRSRYDELDKTELTNVGEELRIATVRHGDLISRLQGGAETKGAWSEVVAKAVVRFVAEGKEYNGRYFRKFVLGALDEREEDTLRTHQVDRMSADAEQAREETRRNRVSGISAETVRTQEDQAKARLDAAADAELQWFEDASQEVKDRIKSAVDARVKEYGGTPSRELLLAYGLAVIREQRETAA